jgi:glycosyltransferase involved in cell wall biosynthesis
MTKLLGIDLRAKIRSLLGHRQAMPSQLWSRDDKPWLHPYLTRGNIQRFRAYSEQVWQFAGALTRKNPKRLRVAFAVNMAQNMYNWARLAARYGAEARLYLHEMDKAAISLPQWEDFDGEFPDVHDGEGFLLRSALCAPVVPCQTIPLTSKAFASAFSEYVVGRHRRMLRLLSGADGIRFEVFKEYPEFIDYFEWARELSKSDVGYCAAAPFAAYASGKPYCVVSVGGDLQIDCGRPGGFGRAMSLAFAGGRFLFASNPHTLGHSRRLGLANAVYLPYPMDTTRYCPGEGEARARWEAEFGSGIYFLTTTRIDSGVKGHTEDFFQALREAARQCPNIRYVFLAWGSGADWLSSWIKSENLGSNFIVQMPVGKKRLIDYYRSCDAVLDQFAYGYFGASALEAASVGKPVIMRTRLEHYEPLYSGDAAPVLNVSTPAEVLDAIVSLAKDKALRCQSGTAMREWILRNHGEERTIPIMLSLLQVAADKVPLPADLVNPLLDDDSEEELAYHRSCLRQAP